MSGLKYRKSVGMGLTPFITRSLLHSGSRLIRNFSFSLFPLPLSQCFKCVLAVCEGLSYILVCSYKVGNMFYRMVSKQSLGIRLGGVVDRKRVRERAVPPPSALSE